MQEFEQKILEQYDIEVNSTRKVRGAVLCETNKGVFLYNIRKKNPCVMRTLYMAL